MAAAFSTPASLPAETLELGDPTAEYKPSTGRTAGGGIAFLAGAALCTAVSIGSYNEGDSTPRLLIIMGVLILAFLGGAVWQFWLAISNRNLRIVVFERGLASIRGGRADILRWDDITTVTQQVTDHYRYGVKVNTSHVYRVTLQNGRKVAFNDVIKNVGTLGETIQQKATAHLLPEAIRTLDSGTALTFNRLIISREGIGTVKGIAPWPEVDSVQMKAGLITVTRNGKSWISQTAAQTPNLFVFLALAERMKGSRS